jgi:hypothetical protein
VSTDAVIRRLNKVAIGWDFKITKTEWREDLLLVYGELTIPGLGTRSGIGVQKVSERGGEDLVKGASSDSLKKSATLFGVALHLYGPDTEQLAKPILDPRVSLLEALKDEAKRLDIDVAGGGIRELSTLTRRVCESMDRGIEKTIGASDVSFAIENLAKWNLDRKAREVASRTPSPVPTEDTSEPTFTDRLLDAPAPTVTVSGNYATNEPLGNMNPTGGKRKVS